MGDSQLPVTWRLMWDMSVAAALMAAHVSLASGGARAGAALADGSMYCLLSATRSASSCQAMGTRIRTSFCCYLLRHATAACVPG